MTGSVRRAPGRAGPRLSSRTRAILVSRRAGVSRRDSSRPAGSASIARVLLAIALAAVVGIGTLAGVGLVAGAGVIGALANGLPDPTDLDALTFNQPTIVYDRTGTVELARFERENRRVVAYRRAAAARPRRDDHRRGPHVLGERRVRSHGHRRGGRAERFGREHRRAGRFNHHPAARPCAAAARGRDQRQRQVHAQGARGDPGVAAHGRLPGRGRQGEDRHRVPERDLLRPRGLRNRRGRHDLLRRERPGRADAVAGGAPRGPAQGAFRVRPVSVRREGRRGPPRASRPIRRRSCAATTCFAASAPVALDDA